MRFRGWALVAGERVFSAWCDDEQKAYRAAIAMRQAPQDGTTLGAAVDDLLEEVGAKRTAGSLRWYRGHLDAVKRKIPEQTPLHRVTPAALEQFVRDRLQDWAVEPDEDGVGGRRVKPATVNADLRALHRVFAVALRRGTVDSNPVRLVDRPREDRPAMDWLTADELRAVLEKISDERARDIISFFALTGVRRSEAARLERGHVRDRLRQLVVPGKTGTRIVPLSENLDDVVTRLLAAAGERLFAGTAEIDKAFRTWAVELGDRRLHPHALRHTFATALVRQGERPDVVMRLLGHRSITTTTRYWHEVGEDAVAAVRRLQLLPRAPDQAPAATAPPHAGG